MELRLEDRQLNQSTTVPRLPNQLIGSILVLFLVSAVIALVWWKQAPVSSNDTGSYLLVASDLTDGQLDHAPFRALLYPLFLLLTGSFPIPGKTLFVIGLLLHLVAVLCVATLLQWSRAPSYLILIFSSVMFLPYNVQSAGLVLTENLTEFLLSVMLTVAVYSIQKRHLKSAMVAGALIALAAFTRPTYQLLGPSMVLALGAFVVMRWRLELLRKLLVPSIVLVVAASLPVIVYSQYNLRHFGFFGITYQMGGNLLNRTIPLLEDLPNDYEPIRSELIRCRNLELLNGKSHTASQYQFECWQGLRRLTGKDNVGLAAALLDINKYLIIRNPLDYAGAVASSVSRSFFPNVSTLSFQGSRGIQALWIGCYLLTLILFLIQFWLAGGQCLVVNFARVQLHDEMIVPISELTYLWTALLVFYTVAISSLFDVGDPRQRSPVDIFMLANTILGWTWLVVMFRRKRNIALAPAVSEP